MDNDRVLPELWGKKGVTFLLQAAWALQITSRKKKVWSKCSQELKEPWLCWDWLPHICIVQCWGEGSREVLCQSQARRYGGCHQCKMSCKCLQNTALFQNQGCCARAFLVCIRNTAFFYTLLKVFASRKRIATQVFFQCIWMPLI